MVVVMLQQQKQQQQRQITIVLVLVVELMLMTNNAVSTQSITTNKNATTATNLGTLEPNLLADTAAVYLNKPTTNETNLNQTQQQQQEQQVIQHLLPVLNTKNDQNIFKYESIAAENVANVTNFAAASNENQRNFTKPQNTAEIDDNRSENLANHFNSSEILLESDDVAENASVLPTTYRPSSPTRSPQASAQASAQDRERKLMNLLAARRSALHRTGVRQRIGTTSRTAIETTSKSPTDPRSICIRNCTKNFTRRTTASCMRQCANFSRTPSIPNTPNTNTTTVASTNGTATAATGVVFRSTTPATQRKLAEKLNPERDTNEILFSDESSHGVFVVAKEQNDTLNHITELVKPVGATKLRQRGKPASQQSTVASTSIEDDDLQPYLYFGQKLPPIKPALLTITSVSDDHPKLLEVSLAQLATTTPATPKPTPSLSAVERSRARFKYYMRDRGTSTAFARRNSATARPPTSTEQSVDLKAAAVQPSTTTSSTTSSPTISPITSAPAKKQKVEYLTAKRLKDALEIRETVREALAFRTALAEAELKAAADAPPSSTPLIITVLSDDLPEEVPTPMTTTTTTTTTPAPTSPPTSTPIPTPRPTPTSTTTTVRTTTTPKVPELTPQTTKLQSTTTTTTTTTSTSTTTTTTTTPKMPPKNTISDSETELLRALGPSLTQPIATDEKTNLIIFYNRIRGNGSGSSTTTSTVRPTTDNSFNIIRTTVLTSVRSTVNPQQSAVPSTNGENTPSLIVGIVESASSNSVGGSSSTVESNENKISAEKRRMNIVTMVLAGIGFVPLLAILLYVGRNFIARRHAKDDEDFDVCITDQQPISPVKKLDSNGKYNNAVEDEDEVDNHLQHIMSHHSPQHQQQSQHNGTAHHGAPFKHVIRDVNYDRRYDEQGSVTSSEQDFERRNIRLKSLLGEGNFGQVWKAEADNLSGHFGATRIVAVKTIRAHSAQKSLKDEATIMRKLGSHPNVVTLLGASVTSQPHMLIMEYAMRGRLLSLLRAARNATNILPASVPGGRSLAPLSPRTLAGFALDIACGMEYIAERRIVHRDLAARNVLLDHNGVCKICDFGMSIDLDAERKRKEQEKNTANELMRHSVAAATQSKFKKFDFGSRFIMQHWHNSFGQNANQSHQQYKDSVSEKKGHGHGHGHDTISRRPALPIRWMAPEALQFNIFSTETDIWAFGIVLWEIATLGSTPYPQLSGREVIRRVPNGLRPELPKESNHEFYNLMARCWHKDPNMRPSFTQSRLEITRSLHKWVDDDSAASDYMDVSGFSEDLEHGVVYFNHRISEFECEI